MPSRPRLRPVLALAVLLAVGLVPVAATEGESADAGAPAVEIGDESELLYAVGVALGRNLNGMALTAEELASVQEGLRDAALGNDVRVDPADMGSRMNLFLQDRMQRAVARQREQGDAFRAEMAAEEGAETLGSGVVFRRVAAGDGPTPGATDRVLVHYTGTLPDGTVFDTSREDDPPAPREFALDRVIPCFSEGIGRMKVGGSAVLVCPPEQAYGDRGVAPTILPGSTLRFDLELVGIVGAIEDAAGETDGDAAGDDGGADGPN